MREYGIGQSVPRVEDRRLLTGLGRYTDDRKVAGAAFMAVVLVLFWVLFRDDGKGVAGNETLES